MEQLTEMLKKKYSDNVYIGIFNILQNEENYSFNSNGIFFNLKNVEQEKIQRCIEYLKNIEINIEDHIEKLSVRENIENDYKTILNEKKPKKPKKIIQRKVQKEVQPPKPKKFKGAYARINDILHHRKSKIKKEIIKKEDSDNEDECKLSDKESDTEISEKEIDITEDLFGDLSDEES